MAVARQIAHLTYRSEFEMHTRFGRENQPGEDPASGGRYAVQSYLEYHGTKLGRRFDPNSYLRLTEAMNSHDIGRGRGGLTAALERITAELTVAVVDSDRLFPPHLGIEIAAAPTARPLIVAFEIQVRDRDPRGLRDVDARLGAAADRRTSRAVG